MIFHEVCMQTILINFIPFFFEKWEVLQNLSSVALRAMAFLTLRKHCNFRPWNDLSACQVILQVLRSQPAKLCTFSAIFEHCILIEKEEKNQYILEKYYGLLIFH